MDRWYYWDGRRWCRDTPKAIKLQNLAQIVTDRMLQDELPRLGDNASLRKAFLKHAASSRNMGKTRAMVEQARSLPELIVHSDELDSSPVLLNCINGTLNIETAAMQPHDKADYITKLTGCEWRGVRTDQTWESFLDASTRNNDTLRNFLQRAAGYSIQGSNPEERFFMVYGPAGSGKSTFVTAIQKALGEYAISVEASTFTSKGNAGETREDLVKLRGMHLVTTGEVDEGRSWSAAALKRLTSNDLISARALYSPEIEFTPGFKIWITTNTRPIVQDSSDGFWRRVVVIPFDHAVPASERDTSIKVYLTNDQTAFSAILAWCLAGYKRWQQEGPLSRMPEEVSTAINSYREDTDPLADFISEMCTVAPGETARAGTIYESYVQWAGRRRETAMSQAQFKQSLVNRGFQRARTREGFRFQGISVRSTGADIQMVSSVRSDDPFAPRPASRN
jgi:putative DNA primase/helicase